MKERERERRNRDGDRGLAAELAVMERRMRRLRRQRMVLERVVRRRYLSRLR
jgi:hypothetical protein